ncbi:SDR family NAD(P)-dependent oxidoreductase [Paenibacillus sp. BR2-3]|uniref:SDR family NAD(P)-dependent oxidoreductase n=1 Tax=Paenibacillus sp. BR2-3 TaxID=3048494 RepID=UPI0039773362
MSNNDIHSNRPFYLFLFSAKTREGLIQRLADLKEWAGEEPETNAGNIAYTLSIGRSHFHERAALIARDTEELKAELLRKQNELMSPASNSSNNSKRKHSEKEDQLRFSGLVEQLEASTGTDSLYKEALHKIADLYMEGCDCDWSKLYQDRPYYKIPLPTYPFQKNKYWLNLKAEKESTGGKDVVHSLCPVLDYNRSTVHEQIFEKGLTGEEFYLKDHVVSGHKLLPGVVQLEMALSAATCSLPGTTVRKITNVVWSYPIQMDNDESGKPVQIRLFPGESDSELGFEITSVSSGETVIHSQGNIGYAEEQSKAPLESIDIAALSRNKARISGAQVYEKFRKHQLHLGPAFQSMTEMYAGDTEAVAFIELPAHLREDFAKYTLHPTVIDGVLEAVIGLVSSNSDHEGAVALPFSFDSMEIFGPIPANCVSYVQKIESGNNSGDQAFDVVLADEQGRVLLKFTRFVLKVFYQGRQHSIEEMGFSYQWKDSGTGIRLDSRIAGDIVIFADHPDLVQEIAKRHQGQVFVVEPGLRFQQEGEYHYLINPSNKQDYVQLFRELNSRGCSLERVLYERLERGASSEFDAAEAYQSQLYMAQALMEVQPGHTRVIQICKVQNDMIAPVLGALRGFNKTLKLENSKLHFTALFIGKDSLQDIYPMIAAEVESADYEVLYKNGKRYIHTLTEIKLPSNSGSSEILRSQGVYCITGGLGKLGLILAEYLAGQFQAKLVLIGRSSLRPEHEQKIAYLKSLGAEVHYVRADISQEQEAIEAVAEVKSKFGVIHGLIHCAGVAHDSFIASKNDQQATEVLQAKIQGLVQLDRATQDDKLDFVVAFSSIAAITGNIGQSDYAYANAFMDYYAAYRHHLVQSGQRYGKSISINWPLWKDGGMSVNDQTLLFFKNTVGLKPLQIADGLAYFHSVVNADVQQILILQANRKKISGILGLESASGSAGTSPFSEKNAELKDKVQQAVANMISHLMKIDPAAIQADQDLGEYGFNSITFTDAANVINDTFSVRITPAIFFEYPTVRSLAAYLAETYEVELLDHFNRGEEQAVLASVDYGTAKTAVSGIRCRQNWKKHKPDASGKREPIAIIGISGTMPQSKDMHEFWDNLKDQKDLISEIPGDRWDYHELNRLKSRHSEKPISSWGGFMEDADKFDPAFFNINPREADLMDPQQRIFLETVWSTIEDAGYRASELSGKKVGLFVGVSTSDYSTLLQDNDIEVEAYSSTGSSHCVLANRISYLFNFRGPSEPIDTACSSSLVAVHRAVESIANGDCDQAIAGGVNVIVSPTLHISFSRAGMLSPDGRCKTFDQNANGYVRGEGAGAILLKPLSQAEADGDYIYAVIKGTAINHGGKVSSLTVPNPKAQAEVLVEAYDKAGISPDTIGYIEAHGTGTSLGDPVEVNALKNAFKDLYQKHQIAMQQTRYCGLGAVKTNIGHLEAAAGIAGVLKIVMAMKHKLLPGNVHFEQLNPFIEMDHSPFYIVEKTQEWKTIRGENRRAGVSSFGFGGVNAHVVLEEYNCSVVAAEASEPGNLIVLSAKNKAQLLKKAKELVHYLTDHAEIDELTLHNIAYTLQVGREEMEERIAFTARDKSDMLSRLGNYVSRPEGEASILSQHVDNRQKRSAKPQAIDNQATGEPVGFEGLNSIMKQWIAGESVNWSAINVNRKGRRIPLPAYPFAKEVCWVSKNTRRITPKLSPGEERSALHPMVDSNVSTMEEEKFKKTLRLDQSFLKDHVVGGKILLPGVAYLEMVRAAADLAGIHPITGLKDIRWIKAIEMDTDRKDIFTTFQLSDNNELEYRVFSEVGDQRILHSYGKILRETPAAAQTIEVGKIKEKCSVILEKEECYEHIFKGVGFDYGPAFKVTNRAYCAELEGLSELSLPDHLDAEYEQYALHPSIIDGAVRSVSWVGRRTDEDLTLRVPFALDRMELIGEVPKRCYAYAKPSEGATGTDDEGTRKYDIQIVNEDGQEVVRLFGFSIKQYAPKSAVDQPIASINLYTSKWVEATIPAESAAISSVLVFGTAPLADSIRDQGLLKGVAGDCIIQVSAGAGFAQINQGQYVIHPAEEADYHRLFDSLMSQGQELQHIIHAWNMDDAGAVSKEQAQTAENLDAHLDQGLYSILYVLKATAALKAKSKIRCLYAYTGSDDRQTPLNEMVAGFSESLSADHPLFQLSLVRMNEVAPAQAAERLIQELNPPHLANGTVILYDGETRYLKKLFPHQIIHQSEGTKFVKGGVYIITGGTGALGMIVATELAEKYQARLVLSGRQESDEQIQAKLERLASLGAEAIYIKADVASDSDTTQLIMEAKRSFHRINGIIHCAGMGDTTKVSQGSKASFSRILSPKVNGTVYLDLASKDEPLDLFILFSSTSVEIGDMGACSYAAANTFMDRYAVYRDKLTAANQRQGKTVSINWPLWKDGRYQIEAAQQQLLSDYYGMQPLDSQTGMDILESILKEDVVHVFAGYGDQKKIRRSLGIGSTVSAGKVDTDSESSPVISGELLDRTQAYLVNLLAKTMGISKDRIGHASPLDSFGLDSIMILELNEALQRDFEGLPNTLFYEYNTVQSLAGYFMEQYREQLVRQFKLAQSHKLEVTAQEENVQRADSYELRSSGTPLNGRFLPKPKQSVPAEAGSVNGGVMDIAVIGMDGRFPMASNMSELWENLKDGKDCITEIPKDRWDYTKDYDVEKGKKGKIYTKYGGFIDDVDKFDPLFFQMTPRDAQLTDPQERLFLECAYHTVEDAGYTRERLAQTKVGVFVGVMYGHYQLIGTEGYASGNLVAPNSSFASIANRVSYLFNFQGPSMAIDTMCSSSLTAIHLACESIRRGESDTALAGGVNVTIHRNKYVFLCSQRFASSEGKCRAFGEGGDGYVASEGVGAVLLKPLSKAIEDGDHIYGVIKGSAINSGGKTSGYTVPNPNAQAAAIAEAIQRSGINPRSITSLEAHGTGTSLGDPIEIAGLSKAFGQYTNDKQFCSISSVKSNIGHLESAAGIASLAKVLLQLKHRTLVPSIHTDELNNHIHFEDTPFYVQRTLDHWEQTDQAHSAVRRAGISSFGAGGSNVHLIVEEFVSPQAANETNAKKLIVLSAKNPERLMEKVNDLYSFLGQSLTAEYSLANISYTLNLGREEMEERIAIVSTTMEELKAGLKSVLDGQLNDSVCMGNAAVALENGATIFGNDPEDIAYITALAKKNQLERVAKLWVLGNPIDWSILYAGFKPQKVSLPLYPFAKERYWLENAVAEGSKSSSSNLDHQVVRTLHPLVDVNISTLREQRFRKRLSVEQFYLRDHIVADQILLPGVAYIEMARAAGEICGEAPVSAIRDVVWLKPVVMTEDFKDLDIVLEPVEDAVHYEIFSTEQGNRVVHSRGLLEFAADAPAYGGGRRYFDLNEIKRRCTNRKDKQDCYQNVFKGIGFNYGPSFQVTEEVLNGEMETLARLSLTEAYRPTLQDFVLHPALFDGAIRSVAAGRDAEGRATHIPFSLGNVEIFGAIPSDCCVYTQVKEQPGENNQGLNIFDISILDLDGNEVVRIEDFIVRPFAGKPEGQSGDEILYYTPVYEKEALTHEIAEEKRNVLIFGDHGTKSAPLTNKLPSGFDACILVTRDKEYKVYNGNHMAINPSREEDYVRLLYELKEIGFDATHILHQWAGSQTLVKPGDYNEDNIENVLEQMMQDGAFSVIYLFKAFVKVYGQRPLKLLFAYQGESGYFTAPHEMVASFAKSIVTIHHKFQIASVSVDHTTLNTPGYQETLFKELFSEGNKSHTDIRYIDQQRHVRKIMPFEMESINGTTANSVTFKEGGVYLIPGGAGALGMIFSKHIAQQYRARIVCVGRQPENERITRMMNELRIAGGEGRYLEGDISSASDVKRIMDRIRSEYGMLDGIIHCAGQGDSVPVTESDSSRARTVMGAKVQGLLNLDLQSRGFDLDFMILFSSVSVELGDLGVGYYSMANSFMDRFTIMRNELASRGQRKGKTLSINWPLWSDGGFEIPENESVFYSGYLGMKMMSEGPGIRAFEEICRAGSSNLIVATGNKSKIDHAFKLERSKPDQEVSSNDKDVIVDLLTKLQAGELSEADVEQWMGGIR